MHLVKRGWNEANDHVGDQATIRVVPGTYDIIKLLEIIIHENIY